VEPGLAPELVDDEVFDDWLPLSLQIKASTHFTPIEVARHVAKLLAPEQQGMTVLDVGSGAGKFCIGAGLAAPWAQFVGVELRPRLVRLADRLARTCGLPNVRFVHANALDLDWSAYDAFYFYNPFAEQMFDAAFVIDDTIEMNPSNYVRYVTGVGERLARARLGTRVATYHGFGATPPPGYELIHDEAFGSDRVELWIKTQPIAASP